MNRIVYRIENSTGEGPFAAALKGKNGLTPANLVNRLFKTGVDWPPPEGTYPRYFRFGFASLDQLKTWFPPTTHPVLKSWGLDINVYEVPEDHVIDDVEQVVFNPMLAKKVEGNLVPLQG